MKKCSQCKLLLPLDRFGLRKRRGVIKPRSECKECEKKYRLLPKTMELRKKSNEKYFTKERIELRRIDASERYKTKERKDQLKSWYENGGREKIVAYQKIFRKTDKFKAIQNRFYLKHKNTGRFESYRIMNRIMGSEKKPCEVCGATKLVHRHHEDYSKPLDVIWLCPLHHKQRHKELKDQNVQLI